MFVGRAAELQTLADVIQGSSRPSAALVTGVAGSGKSRLLSEARRLAPRARWFGVVGFESESRVPLAAAAGLLRSLSTVGPDGTVLGDIAFGRRGRGADDADAVMPRDSGAFEAVRVFEAAHRALASVKDPVLLIDDLQWVDELSLALCHYLVRAAADSQRRMAFLVATRPGGPGDALFESLPEESVRHIELGPLGEGDATALARAIDPQLDADAAHDLWRQARGNPFWLEALTRYGRPGDGLDRVLTRRLRGAGQDASTLLGTLALAGRPLPVDAAAAVLGQGPTRIEAALRTLVERGLAEVEPDGARPAHDLIRTNASAQLPRDLRMRIHEGLAEYFEREAGADLQMLRVALQHRRAAGLPVVPLAARLAASAWRRLLGADGVADLGAIADEADPFAADTLALQAGVARLADELGEHDAALGRWLVVADHEQDVRVRAVAALSASRAAYAIGRAGEARELLDRSRGLVSDDPALAIEHTAHDAAICLWLEGRGVEGRALAQRASTMARKPVAGGRHRRGEAADLLRAAAEAMRVEYEAAMQLGDPVALLDVAERREAAARKVGLEDALEASIALGAALRQNGRVREALARFRRVWSQAHRAVLPRLSVDAGFWLGRTLLMTGELEEAERVVGEATRVASRIGDVARARHRLAQLEAGVEMERGRGARGRAVLDGEISRSANEHPRIVLHADRALWAARLDGASAVDAVRVNIEAGEACARTAQCPRCTGEFLLLTAEALGRIGHRDAAREAIARRDALGPPLEDLDRLAHRHASALATDDAGGRASALEATLAAAEASPYRLATLWIRLDIGRELAALGDPRAVVELERAVAEANERGASTVRELAEGSLRSLGVRTWRRGSAGAPLTAREEEVARLVAGGATNREVASTLFLSPKTVERHLVNLFRKLEVRNRTELAARLAESEQKRTGITG